jgi:hypothetical protein
VASFYFNPAAININVQNCEIKGAVRGNTYELRILKPGHTLSFKPMSGFAPTKWEEAQEEKIEPLKLRGTARKTTEKFIEDWHNGDRRPDWRSKINTNNRMFKDKTLAQINETVLSYYPKVPSTGSFVNFLVFFL